jgi:hypothetical protein
VLPNYAVHLAEPAASLRAFVHWTHVGFGPRELDSLAKGSGEAWLSLAGRTPAPREPFVRLAQRLLDMQGILGLV